MKRTTIFVPVALEHDLQLYARRERRSAASVVREAVTEYLAVRQADVPLPSFAGAFDSGRSDTAERHEEILFQHLDPHGRRAPPSRPARGRKMHHVRKRR